MHRKRVLYEKDDFDFLDRSNTYRLQDKDVLFLKDNGYNIRPLRQ
jgi:hypothetical protein